jgi:hypothetical protein
MRPIKQIKTSGDWFITWGSVFPHWKSELDVYRAQILSLFTMTSLSKHSHIQSLNKAIRVWVSECYNLLLTDWSKFDNLQLQWLNPIRAGEPMPKERARAETHVLTSHATAGTVVSADQNCQSAGISMSAENAMNHTTLSNATSRGRELLELHTKQPHYTHSLLWDGKDDVLSDTA